MAWSVRLLIMCLLLLLNIFNSPLLAEVPLRVEELLKKGIEEYRAENYEEALVIFKELSQRAPSTIVSFYLGLLYKQTGDYPQAKVHFLEALRGKPRVNDAYVELVEILYHLNELKEALFWIDEAERASISPPQIAFLKGMVLMKLGKFEEARKAFEKAKSLDAKLTQAADLQIALTYSAERRIKEAMKALENLIKVEPKTDMAEFAKDYLKTLKRAFKEWAFQIGLSYQYDDNVVSKPMDKIGVPAVDEISRKGDSGIINTFKINYRPLLESRFSLDAEAYFYMKTYFKLYRYDTILGSFTLSPGFNFQRGFFGLPMSYSRTWLNEREYSENYVLNPTLTFQVRPGHLTQLTVGYSKRRMLYRMKGADPNEKRDSDGYNLAAAYFHPFKEKGLFYLRFDHFRDATSGKNWNSFTHKVASGLIYPLTEKLNLQLAADYARQDYRHIHTLSGKGIAGFPDKPTKRKDDLYSITSGLIWELSSNLRLNGNYYYYRADSNFPIYDYKKNVYTLELNLTF